MSNITLSVSIMSGKGGVGKTNIALNLAYALHQNAFPTLLMDCDMGLANLDVLLGITPEGNLQDALLGNTNMSDVLYHLEENGLDVLPAASGVPDLVELDKDQRKLLIHRLNPILTNYHYVFMDLGAGITDMVQHFATMAALRIVVITPEPTSLTDSYALIKVLYTNHNVRDFKIIVNQVENPKDEERSFERLRSACHRFLGINPTLLGSIRTDPKLIEAVRRQKPLMREANGSPASVDIQNIAARLQGIRLSMLGELAQQAILKITTE